MVPQEPSHLSGVKGQPETELCDQLCRSQWDLGEEDQWQHQDEDLPGPAAARALRDPPEVSGLTSYSVLPLTPFLERFLVLFCFPLNRKFLTWGLLLGHGKWRIQLWILQGAVVASHSPSCVLLDPPRLLPVVGHHETLSLLGALGVCFTSLFFCLYFCFFFFKLSLLWVWRDNSIKISLGFPAMKRSRKGYTLQCVFMFWIWLVDHLATFFVGPNSLFPQKLGAKVLEEGD